MKPLPSILNARSSARGKARRGVAILEAMVAGMLLAVLITLTLRMFAAAAVERRVVEKRTIALEQVAGAIERTSALAWDEITLERLAKIRLAPSIEQILPGAALAWTLEPADSNPSAKHLRAELSWQNPTGAPAAPVRLNYWVYQPASDSAGGSP